jgi:hypothetical protein
MILVFGSFYELCHGEFDDNAQDRAKAERCTRAEEMRTLGTWKSSKIRPKTARQAASLRVVRKPLEHGRLECKSASLSRVLTGIKSWNQGATAAHMTHDRYRADKATNNTEIRAQVR